MLKRRFRAPIAPGIDPTLEVYGLTNGSQLRLITCDGEFDRSTGHYVDNLVVFATAI